MKQSDVRYWMSPRFDPAPPTDGELTSGHLISKSQLARLLAGDIKMMVERGSTKESIAFKLDQLALMVKDDEPEEEGSNE